MNRRTFISVLGGAAAWPITARAQQTVMPMIGYVTSGFASASQLAGFRRGMSEAGIVEGRAAVLEIREASNQYEMVPGLLADVIARHAAVIFASGAASAVAAKAATSTTPIVFGMGEDPIALGLVQSLNRPGANITGVTYLNSTVVPKRIEMLREVVPQAQEMAVLVNPKSPNAAISIKDAQEAARTLDLRIHVVSASTALEIDAAFEQLEELNIKMLLIAPDGLFISNASQLAILAALHRVAASHEFRIFPDVGGLMSYGGSNIEGARQAGIYVGRILKGEKPAELPIVQPTQFELVVNLRTARVLRLTVPATLRVLATEIIE
jgi:putative ABC transport system substrate-binding protein